MSVRHTVFAQMKRERSNYTQQQHTKLTMTITAHKTDSVVSRTHSALTLSISTISVTYAQLTKKSINVISTGTQNSYKNECLYYDGLGYIYVFEPV